MTTLLLTAALDYAARGLPIFPCNGDKSPKIYGGFHKATVDQNQITEWWTKWPDALIGMATGSPSGFAVLDIDKKKGRDGFKFLPDWESLSPVIVMTRSGGAHIYFRDGGFIRSSTGKNGIDVRGEGGYVIVPPSPGYSYLKGEGTAVGELPPWPAHLSVLRRDNDQTTGGSRDVHDLALVSAALEAISNDDMDWENWNNVGMAIWRATNGSEAGCQVFDQWSQKSRKYDQKETRVRWEHYSSSPPDKIGAGALFHLASKENPNWRKGTGGFRRTFKFSATPFQWVDAARLPRRQFLYGHDYIQSYLSLLLATGGMGKSSLALAETLAMVSGKPILGTMPPRPLKVWYWNGEDPMDELQRRIAAICKHYGLGPADLGDRLFIDSGRLSPMKIVEDDGRTAVVNAALVEEIVSTISENGIDVFIIDPFVAAHSAPENDNNKIGQVAGVLASIADLTSISVMLIHHTRKTGGERATVEDGRGASALLAAARSARVISAMTKEEAESAGIEQRERGYYFRCDLGKANLTPPAEAADWYKHVSVDLENTEGVDWDQGDWVGVVTRFTYPKREPIKPGPEDIRRTLRLVAAGGPWREDQRARREAWVGDAIARGLFLDVQDRISRRAIVQLISDWIAAGLLKRVEQKDGHRTIRPYIQVGPAAEL